MDSARGGFSGDGGPEMQASDAADEIAPGQSTDAATPASGAPGGVLPVGNERRMQVRAYNFWARLLANRNFPHIADLRPDELSDFGPNSILLDFTQGLEDPLVSYLGEQLAAECDAQVAISRLRDIPFGSLLTRITDHYLQIIANEAPIGFEAEFVNQRGITILYRGILLPFSRDDASIDYVYGVINWKERAQGEVARPQLDAAQTPDTRPAMLRDPNDAPLAEWADGPADFSAPGALLSDADSIGDFEPAQDYTAALRTLETRPLDALSNEGAEFAVLVARRRDDGSIVLVGEVTDEPDLLERAARRLLR